MVYILCVCRRNGFRCRNWFGCHCLNLNVKILWPEVYVHNTISVCVCVWFDDFQWIHHIHYESCEFRLQTAEVQEFSRTPRKEIARRVRMYVIVDDDIVAVHSFSFGGWLLWTRTHNDRENWNGSNFRPVVVTPAFVGIQWILCALLAEAFRVRPFIHIGISDEWLLYAYWLD